MKRIILIVLCLFLIFSLSACQESTLSDAQKFKQEYESLNEEEGMSSIVINEDNSIRYVDQQELLEGLQHGTHVIYMGWNSCLWCRRAIPVLIEATNKYAGLSIYYYSLQQARQDYENGKDSSEAAFYKQVATILQQSGYDFGELIDCFDDGTYKIVASLIIFVKGGQIVGATKRTVDSHVDPYEPLTAQQIEEVAKKYDVYLKELADYDPVSCYGC